MRLMPKLIFPAFVSFSLLVLLGCSSAGLPSPSPSSAVSGSPSAVTYATATGTYAAVGAPGSAPAVCATPPAGPVSPPPGAVKVDPSVLGDLSAKTLSSPAGTTFWLAPGVHKLDSSPDAQVSPKDGDVYLGAPGAILDGQNVNEFAFTRRAADVTIRYLTVQNFNPNTSQAGVVNHDGGTGWVIADDAILSNHGAGVRAGANQQVLRSCLKDNGQYGIAAPSPLANVAGHAVPVTGGLVVKGNEIVGNDADNIEAQHPGCGCSGGAKFFGINGADITGNWVHDNHTVGLWVDTDNNDFLISDNVIENNAGVGLFYEISYNGIIRDNTFRNNAVQRGKQFADRSDLFPVGAVYISESGGEPRLPARTDHLEISGNLLDRNWGGITAWEDANRFCNSNPAVRACTLLVRDRQSCSQPGISTQPFYSDCRWKTQRLDIHDNTFVFDPTAVGCTNSRCGLMALISNPGMRPWWTPYQGTVIEDAVTFGQGNSWHNNTYSGPWQFMAHDTRTIVSFDAWRAAPYSQDAASTLTQTSSNRTPSRR